MRLEARVKERGATLELEPADQRDSTGDALPTNNLVF
jgi:hypothetical protein